MAMTNQRPRWDPYFIRGGKQFPAFWAEHLSVERRLLFVLGKGFDPRMTRALDCILNQSPAAKCDGLLLEYNEGPESSSTSYEDICRANFEDTLRLISTRGKLTRKDVPMWESSGTSRRRVGSRNAARVFSDFPELTSYTDVVVDISALPRSLYFPLLGGLLNLIDRMSTQVSVPVPNLHIVVCENYRLDREIREIGIDDDATYLPGFAADLEAESYRDVPTVWFPVLGESQRINLQRLNELINPDEVVLVLPWPSVNPRRADALVGEYHDLLFDQWRIEPSNVIYAPERNPFEAYRQIRQAALGYTKALKPMGGCKTAISSGSSKLLSLGVFLAAYELKNLGLPVGLAHVEAKGYSIPDDFQYSEIEQHNELYTLWLSGACYEL